MNNHIHRYRRINIGRDGKEYWVMQCALPKCTHYQPMVTKLSCPSLVDKECICNRCGNPFILDRRAIRMEKPCCIGCAKRKKKIADVDDFFKELEKTL